MDTQPPASAPVKRPQWPGYLLGLCALGASVAALATASIQPCGWGIYSRPFLALFGLAGGALLLAGDPWWKFLLRLWAVAQMVIVVVDPSGPLTRQGFLWLAWEDISRSFANGRVIEANGYGVNFAAVVYLLLLQIVVSRRWHPQVPIYLWQFQFLRLVRSLFVLCVVACVGLAAGSYHPLVTEEHPLLVIDAPPPGAEIWEAGHRLGVTPLVVTHEKLVEWGVSKASRPPACSIKWSPLEEGLHLTGNSGTTSLLLKAPAWCASRFASFATPWGARALPQPTAALKSGPRVNVAITPKAQPGLTLELAGPAPSSCAPGQEAAYAVRLLSNPPDSLAPGPPLPPQTARALLKVSFQRGGALSMVEVPLPADWISPPIAAELRQDFKVRVPTTPGRYLLRFSYARHGGAGAQETPDHGLAWTYAYLDVK